MADLPEPDIDAAVGWLRAWHGDGPWTVFEIDPNVEGAAVPARTFADETKLRAYLADRVGRVNLYYAANRCDPSVRTTPRKDQVSAALGAFADLDLPKSGPHSAPTQENFAILRRRIEALTPEATALVFSGGGFQGLWRAPEPLTNKTNIELIERAGQSIARELNSDAVQNVNRLLRLPGTVNLPSKKKLAAGRVPALATVVWADWSRTWDPSSDPAPKLPPGFYAGDPDAQQSTPKHLRTLGDLPDKWRKMAQTGDAKDYGGDRSRLVFAFAATLVKRGWSDDEIIPFLHDPAFGISAHCRDKPNPKYEAQRQVARARAAVASDWERTAQGLIATASSRNIKKALSELNYEFEYNEFTDKLNYANGAPMLIDRKDYIDSKIRVSVQEQFGFRPNTEAMFDTIVSLGLERTRHPPREYFARVETLWDGVPRIETWLCACAGLPDNEYVRATSRLMMVAPVRRVRHPGAKFDYMMVLISETQGYSKGKALRALVPDEDWYSDSLTINAPEKVIIEQLSGKLIVECAELTGIRQSDVEALKQFISRQEDRARLAYDRHRSDRKRCCVLYGTTNSIVFLRDRENRRFWPHVLLRAIDVGWIAANRDQLWAEAAQAEAAGESIEFPERLWSVAAIHQEEARLDEPWADILEDALDGVTGRISNQDVWKILGKPAHMRQPGESGRIVDAMREVGWVRFDRPIWIGGRASRGFIKKGCSDRDEKKSVYVTQDPITGQVTVANDPPAGSWEPRSPDPTPPPTPDWGTATQRRREREPGDDDDVPF